MSAAPLLKEKKPRERKKVAVLTVELFRRKDSRFWQAKITAPGFKKKITTRTVIKSSAKEFAQLAYNHFNRVTKGKTND